MDLLVAAQGGLEVPQTPPKRPPYLRKSLRTKDKQRDHKYEEQVRWLKDVADHGVQLTRSRP